MPIVEVITPESNLDRIVADINAASWDEANEMCAYDVEGLLAYLRLEDTVFIVCRDEDEAGTFLGMASGRLQLKPYGQERWFYCDEVDVCVDQRRKGAGAAMMRKLLSIAYEHDCEELWLGTEIDNVAANGLYRALHPDDIMQFVGLTFEMKD